ETRSGASARIGGLDSCQPSAPGAASNSRRISKRVDSLRPHQPSNRGSLAPAYRACTNAPATAPGPEFRYLYEHQAAKSQSLSCRRKGTLPTACAQSKPAKQPCACASFVIAAKSKACPVRYWTPGSNTSAVRLPCSASARSIASIESAPAG